MQIFVLIDNLPELLTEIFELPSSIFSFDTLGLQSLDLSILVFDDIVQSFDLPCCHLELKLVFVDSDGCLTQLANLSLEYFVLTLDVFKLRSLSVK